MQTTTLNNNLTVCIGLSVDNQSGILYYANMYGISYLYFADPYIQYSSLPLTQSIGPIFWLAIEVLDNSTPPPPPTPPPTLPPITLQPTSTTAPGLNPTVQSPSSLIQQELNNGIAYVINPTFVPGNLFVPLNATLQVSVNAYLNISGCLTFNGSVVIDVQDQLLHSSQAIKNIEASCFVNLPQAITVTNINKCQKITGISHTIEGDIFEIVVGVDSICGSSNTSIIIGCVVGVFGFCLLSIVIILAIPSLRYKVLPCTQKNVDKEVTLNEL